MAAPKTKHHIAENGKHLVVHLKRVAQHNVGEIAGYDPDVAAELCEQSIINGKVMMPAAEYAARVFLKKDINAKKYVNTSGPDLKAGTIVAVTAADAETLVKSGEAEYVTDEHVAGIKAAQRRADLEHAQMAAVAMGRTDTSQGARAK